MTHDLDLEVTQVGSDGTAYIYKHAKYQLDTSTCSRHRLKKSLTKTSTQYFQVHDLDLKVIKAGHNGTA